MNTHLDLFSGIGGFALAAQWTGWNTIAFSEVDEFCNAVLRKHWHDVPNLGDINGWRDWPDLGTVSLITGGPPCQPFSVAGRRLGTKDNRDLWPPMLRVIGRYRPDWCVIENVVNATNMVLASWKDDLAAEGYEAQPFDIPSCAVGLPSVERHVWLVAANRSKQLERGKQERFSRQLEQNVERKRWKNNGRTEGIPELPDLPDRRIMRSCKGIPNHVDRIKALGNAVPPQVAAAILSAIRETDSTMIHMTTL